MAVCLFQDGAHSCASELLDIIHAIETCGMDDTRVLARRLIAPKPAPQAESDDKRDYSLSVECAYPLRDQYYDSDTGMCYSVDMLRLDFDCYEPNTIIDRLDTIPIFNNVTTYTSNNMGKYRYMWVFTYADCEHGGTMTFADGQTMEDGSKDVSIAVGYAMNGRGAPSTSGYVEFNPNKCGRMARRLIAWMKGVGCDFMVKRFDMAVDCPIPRNAVRLYRDRRKYEYVISQGGPTEYLGARNAPGRVKVYDKAREQGLDGELTRVELTCSGDWDVEGVKARFPNVANFANVDGAKLDGATFVLMTMIQDAMGGFGIEGAEQVIGDRMIPQRYLSMLNDRMRYKINRMLRESGSKLKIKPGAIRHCMRVARSYADELQF